MQLHTTHPRGKTLGFTEEQIQSLLLRDLSPLRSVSFGVSTSAFQTEGRLDGPNQPATNWKYWADQNRIEKIGHACGLYQQYPAAIELVRSLGLRVFRMGVEWARLCPNNASLDPTAVNTYARYLTHMQSVQLEPIVTLQHFTHPQWLGPDFWLLPESPTIFANHVRNTVAALGDAMTRMRGSPIRRFLTINEPNMLSLGSYAAGVFPHKASSLADGDPLGLARALITLDHLLSAHVHAVRAIHRVYNERKWPTPEVSWNIVFMDVYTVSQMLLDLLRAPQKGIKREQIHQHIESQRDRFYDTLHRYGREDYSKTAHIFDHIASRLLPLNRFESALDAIYSRNEKSVSLVDSAAVDIYDPWSARMLRGADDLIAELVTLEKQNVWEIVKHIPRYVSQGFQMAAPWQWAYDPQAFKMCLQAIQNGEATWPIDIVENGMAVARQWNQPAMDREDGLHRDDFLRGILFALSESVLNDKLQVRTYCHWTLFDNYELGSYTPRFGLFALGDPTRPDLASPWEKTDAQGINAGQILKEFCEAVDLIDKNPDEARRKLTKFWLGS